MIKSTLNLYRKKSKAVTEFKEFAGRGHSLVLDSGWRELAEYCLSWLQAKGFSSNNSARTPAAESLIDVQIAR